MWHLRYSLTSDCNSANEDAVAAHCNLIGDDVVDAAVAAIAVGDLIGDEDEEAALMLLLLLTLLLKAATVTGRR